MMAGYVLHPSIPAHGAGPHWSNCRRRGWSSKESCRSRRSRRAALKGLIKCVLSPRQRQWRARIRLDADHL